MAYFAPLARLPQGALGILKEIARHLLRRPVVGICAVARDEDGRVLLIRRGDTGDWALPGGTLEWGEELRPAIEREVYEETGAKVKALGRLSGVYSRPDRDPRFHAVTICVLATIGGPMAGPKNDLEVREVKLFEPGDLPAELCMGMTDMLQDALENKAAVLE
jgi:8-oxo-dGTP diphosphatase